MEQLTEQKYRRAISRGHSQQPYNETIKLTLMYVCLVVCFLVVITWVTYQLCCLDPVNNHNQMGRSNSRQYHIILFSGRDEKYYTPDLLATILMVYAPTRARATVTLAAGSVAY